MNFKELQAQYIVNEFGERISVILPVSDFEELMEDLRDLAAVAERREEQTIPHEQVIPKLKEDSLL